MNIQKVYADFIKLDDDGNLVLTANESVKDLEKIKNLHDGLQVIFYSDDADENGTGNLLCVDGILKFDANQKYWTGIYDEDKFYHTPLDKQFT